MATSITELAEQLKTLTEYQQTPQPISDEEYEQMIQNAIKRLYIDTQRSSSFNKDWFTYDDTGDATFQQDLPIDEQQYVKLCAQIAFYNKVKADVNRLIGYSTDALTITNADKPYSNIKDTINGLQNERRIIYYKMYRYALEG